MSTCRSSANVASTNCASSIVTTHSSRPLQAPPVHPANVEPPSGFGFSWIVSPTGKASSQSSPHSIPSGVLTTSPDPVPASSTVRTRVSVSNVASTLTSSSSATVHSPAPEQPPPLQPVKMEPSSARWYSVTLVPVS